MNYVESFYTGIAVNNLNLKPLKMKSSLTTCLLQTNTNKYKAITYLTAKN
ncbi:hypothetical protein FLSI110296_15480 [Flavobacterium sinopsychrotolerans]|uniref:Uncharacterized protein n=1 Tax=Flavobacterium sinopsychrotolerans TaxID=604089 RepID=A0A1H8LVN0_9FLAO|nr:hypothetical protein SAMN04487942_1696 [Flavobacterium sinopsychrotolerans]